MPPEGYTTVTISDETAADLSVVMARHDVRNMGLAIKYAVNCALNDKTITNAELARLLYHRLQPVETASESPDETGLP